ncbi:copper amine oxidase N-terminal domain-containing protein [Paenibacillus senegalimassiliensis]|uniref:copper amine oxidase N-terminal domain-containing protein n=1 Tax=Paenibacillus senegalimassiliensis TaxID=1737426 RepID=UPI00073E4E3C|nr:copper amine oxidase N-terminal domain-containing protein [Paenibacillus senegalimassiliensis]
MRKVALFFTLVIVLATASVPAAAHPGRTDSNGGHTCRTNCEKWGLEYGEYHYHNGGSSKSKKSSDSNTKSTQIKATKTTKQTTKKASAPSYEKSSLKLKVNGEVVVLSSSPILVQNINLVPLRELAESLGAATSWDADTQTIRIVKGEQEITLTIGSSKIFYNGVAETLSAAPKVLNGITYVPAQAVARGLNASLSYDKASDTLSITSE